METVVYIHGKGGSAEESFHYKNLFPNSNVIGLDYKGWMPWEVSKEIEEVVNKLFNTGNDICIIANSIGAFFTMWADISDKTNRAYFISPVVDMEKLIRDMMYFEGISEEELREKGEIPTSFGENLSWNYLSIVKDHKIEWKVPTKILYGSKDKLTSYETILEFSKGQNRDLLVMEGGEHWFHTNEQMRFLDKWIMEERK